MDGKYLDFTDAYHVVKALNLCSVDEDQPYIRIIEYVVSKGYDHDDFKDLGRKKAVTMISILSKMAPKFTDLNYFMHVSTFIKDNLNNFKAQHLEKLYEAMKGLEDMQDEELIRAIEERLIFKRSE